MGLWRPLTKHNLAAPGASAATLRQIKAAGARSALLENDVDLHLSLSGIFRCPATGYDVQGEHDGGGQPPPTFVSQNCIACHAVHLVSPTTGKPMAEEVRRPTPPP